MNKNYLIDLSVNERIHLMEITSKGKASTRKIKRANILLLSDQKQHKVEQIISLLGVSISTIYRTKYHFVNDGIEGALAECSRSGQPRKLNANKEALLVSLACSKPHEGCCKWNLELLTDEFVCLTEGEVVSIETVRRRLKKNQLKPWQKRIPS